MVAISQVQKLLRSKKLVATAIRRQVLELLLEPGSALSRKEIELALEGNPDRVTVYRTLKVLCQHQLVHKIIMDDQQVKYKLAGNSHGDDHPHFYCLVCHHMLCLSTRLINTRHIPEGFRVHSTQVVMEGVCGECGRS